MAKYVYPAVFTAEEEGGYSINFPDLEGCYTCGDDLADGIMMAEDILAITLYHYEKENKPIPVPADRSSIKLAENEFINYIATDTLEYQKRYNTKAVKKTLTIPEWLNELAVRANINFSQVLQEALTNKLQV
ncbi:MAG: type II toxin-antitoxin system HicB family antitoxin [Blautia sp.]|nr:type II toxin-antitoxin system HicB family antitoxin [Blautia sp.]